jgi:hypothetical protein
MHARLVGLSRGAWPLVLTLAGTLALAAQTAKAPAPRLVVEPAEFDFGKVLQQTTLTKELTVRNVGSADLVIEQAQASCGCTVVELDLKPLKPGASRSLRLALRTGSYEGRIAKTVHIRSNDPETPVFTVTLRATVAPGTAGVERGLR